MNYNNDNDIKSVFLIIHFVKKFFHILLYAFNTSKDGCIVRSYNSTVHNINTAVVMRNEI